MAEGLITIAEKYLKKGAKVYVQGKLESRKWTDKDGVERYATELVLRPYRSELIMLDPRKDDLIEVSIPELPEDQEAAA
jgi:single-strand DNA-binding protein